MHKVLMISHGYPPVGGSGMLRTLKFSAGPFISR